MRAIHRGLGMLACASVAIGSVAVAGPHAHAGVGDAVLIIGNVATPPVADVVVRDRLTALGMSVTVLDDDAVDVGVVGAADVVLVSATISPSKLGRRLNDLPVPLIVWEPLLYDDLAMTAGGSQSRGSDSGERYVDIVDRAHPLAAALDGRVRVANQTSTFSYGIPGEDATVIATIRGRATRPVIFTYGAGDVMQDGSVAPATRTGLYLGTTSARYWNEAGTALFDAAVAHAMGSSGADGETPRENAAPDVDAGPDVDVEVGAVLQLAGAATDDGLPDGTLATAWIAPPGVTLADPTNPTTAAEFAGPGTYRLFLEASDGVLAASDDVTVRVTEPGSTARTMFVAGSSNPTSSERLAVERLFSLGHEVDVVDDDVADPTDAGGYDLVVISSTIAPYRLDPEFARIAVPILAWEPLFFDELGFTSASSRSGQASGDRVRVASDHPIVDGLGETGDLLVIYGGSDRISWGRVEGSPTVLATVRETTSKAALFVYDVGEDLAEVSAPARRVGMFLGDRGPSRLTPTGWTIFDRTIAWAVSTNDPAVVPRERADDDAVVLYDFASDAGTTVTDRSGRGEALDLTIDGTGWERLEHGGLRLTEPTRISSIRPATKVIDAIVASGEITVEVFVDPVETTPASPGRIVTISPDDRVRNVTLNHGQKPTTNDRFEARLTTTETFASGFPSAETPVGSVDGDLVHVVFTRDATGAEKMYLDGVLADEAVVGGSLAAWNDGWPLTLGSEADGTYPWFGDLHLVAIHDRALDHAAVCQNLAAGPGRLVGVDNRAPYPCLLGDLDGGPAPQTVAPSGASSSDADGSIVSLAWDFGDGTTAVGPDPTHTYLVDGDYTVTLTVTDDDGASTSTSRVVVVRTAHVPAPQPPWFAGALGMRTSGGFFEIDGFRRAEEMLGREISFTVEFLDRGSAPAMRSSSYGLLADTDSDLLLVADRVELVLAVPLGFGSATPRTEAGIAEVAANLQAVARGDFDADYLVVAQRLVDAGFGDAILRLGHEFNGTFLPYSSRFGNEDDFIAAWRHVHGLFEGVSADFRFDWTSLRRPFEVHGPPAWPGDEYVDFVGVDVYWRPAAGDPSWDEDLWNSEYADVLAAQLAFAVEHGKQVSIPEWGVNFTDEPRFIEHMYDWFVSLPASGPGSLAYQAYFDSGNTRERLIDHPRTRESFRALFGAPPE